MAPTQRIQLDPSKFREGIILSVKLGDKDTFTRLNIQWEQQNPASHHQFMQRYNAANNDSLWRAIRVETIQKALNLEPVALTSTQLKGYERLYRTFKTQNPPLDHLLTFLETHKLNKDQGPNAETQRVLLWLISADRFGTTSTFDEIQRIANRSTYKVEVNELALYLQRFIPPSYRGGYLTLLENLVKLGQQFESLGLGKWFYTDFAKLLVKTAPRDRIMDFVNNFMLHVSKPFLASIKDTKIIQTGLPALLALCKTIFKSDFQSGFDLLSKSSFVEAIIAEAKRSKSELKFYQKLLSRMGTLSEQRRRKIADNIVILAHRRPVLASRTRRGFYRPQPTREDILQSTFQLLQQTYGERLAETIMGKFKPGSYFGYSSGSFDCFGALMAFLNYAQGKQGPIGQGVGYHGGGRDSTIWETHKGSYNLEYKGNYDFSAVPIGSLIRTPHSSHLSRTSSHWGLYIGNGQVLAYGKPGEGTYICSLSDFLSVAAEKRRTLEIYHPKERS